MAKEKITKKISIGDLVEKYPKAEEVLMKNGMHCVGCSIASGESIEDGAKAHGINVSKLLKDLNKIAK